MTKAAKLFLDGIFGGSSDSPSTVKITLMNPGRSGLSVNLKGLMIGDPTFSMGNKWGTIINDLSNLQDFASLIGSDSMFTWINASTMCWKGTNPLSMAIEFYLINYKNDLGLEVQLRNLAKLASLMEDKNATIGKSFKAMVHGGYAADIFDSNNKSFWTSTKDIGDIAALTTNEDLSKDLGLYDSAGNAKSSITVQFGNKSRIRNLLVAKIDITESTIEVADQDGLSNRKPLYYKVNVQFTGVRPLLSTDLDKMFKI